jgi:lactobin A/cerein 7B family class IIb bacteriocin
MMRELTANEIENVSGGNGAAAAGLLLVTGAIIGYGLSQIWTHMLK